ncbi:MAG: 50S ribosomal protein L23 [Pseudomonadota bacterium]|nr:50S ribosomal protein L23 [Pseudomonadota bacterium]
MNQARLMQVLIAPHISEKSTIVADKNRQFVFKVLASANKIEIKQAVELLFNVKVKQVQVVNVKGKRKTFGRLQGQRSHWKKAYVGLKEGFDINFMGIE